MPNPIADAYADCIHLPCPCCRAPADDYCTNPITKTFRGVPCVARIQESENDR